MDLNRLPFLPLSYFYHQFSRPQKIFFGVGFGVLLLLLGGLLHAQIYPDSWVLDILEVPQSKTAWTQVAEQEHHYRSFDVSFRAFFQQLTYSAGPLEVSLAASLIFLVIQWLGWSLLITTASMIKSRWSYLFYFLFALFIHFADAARTLIPDQPALAYAVEFGYVMANLGLAYALQSNMLYWSLGLRFLVFSLLNGAILGSAIWAGGWEQAHLIGTNSYFFLVILSVIFIWFLGKEPTNIVFAAATNRPQKSGRLPFQPLLILLLLLLVFEFLLLSEYMPWRFIENYSMGIRPTHLLLLSGAFYLFTSQNHFHQVKHIFSTQLNFTMIMLGLGLVCFSFFFWNYTAGDPLFVFILERTAIIFFVAMGVAHVFFVFGNHLPALRQRVNLFYVMARATRFPISNVFLVGLIAIVSAEGYENKKSITLFMHSYICHQADYAMLKNEELEAAAFYQLALKESPVSRKALYNLGGLSLQGPDQLPIAINYFYEAAEATDDPWARINAATLLELYQEPDRARALLSAEMLKARPHPYLVNNLAVLYQQNGQVDSAILCWKAGLKGNPDLAPLYANLGIHYWEQELPEEARRFTRQAIEEDPSSVIAQTNAAFFYLNGQDSLDLPPIQIEDGDRDAIFLQYNHHLTDWKKHGRLTDGEGLAALVEASQFQFADAMLLEGFHFLQEDSILYATSRMDYLRENFPALAAQSQFLLGLGFYKKNLPEMARKYFLQAGRQGNPFGWLRAAQMDIELGRKDSAYDKLRSMRVTYDTLFSAASVEMALLERPFVSAEGGLSTFDYGGLGFNEQMRMGLYADSLGQFLTARQSFQAAQTLDSMSIAPYLELGRLFNKYRDPDAILNLQAGLTYTSSKAEPLQLELARAYSLQGMQAKADSLLSTIEAPELTWEKLKLEAAWKLAAGDTLGAIVRWDSVHQAQPFDRVSILSLCALYEATEAVEAGNLLTAEALEINTENPDIWMYYAVFARAWNMAEDAGFGALKAIELSDDPRRKREIENRFKPEILAAIANP
ncbi:MAG: hypothetical protein AAFR61_10600 [Bacteroidota bacterium]